ncbi:MAG: hypothetical protein RMJ19_10435 [Gemmatales bacterium]|nr:hypothetical protein [Gemmatales bacterium]MDW8176078.1 hypothetical protein [Gemmatales bacterium]
MYRHHLPHLTLVHASLLNRQAALETAEKIYQLHCARLPYACFASVAMSRRAGAVAGHPKLDQSQCQQEARQDTQQSFPYLSVAAQRVNNDSRG